MKPNTVTVTFTRTASPDVSEVITWTGLDFTHTWKSGRLTITMPRSHARRLVAIMKEDSEVCGLPDVAFRRAIKAIETALWPELD